MQCTHAGYSLWYLSLEPCGCGRAASRVVARTCKWELAHRFIRKSPKLVWYGMVEVCC